MYDVVCPMRETRFSVAHKLITIVTIMSVIGGMVSVVACFALVLVGKSSMVPIFFWSGWSNWAALCQEHSRSLVLYAIRYWLRLLFAWSW